VAARSLDTVLPADYAIGTMRLWLAIKCFFLVLFARRLPSDAVLLLPAAEPARPTLAPVEAEIVKETPRLVENGGAAVRLLALFQREGRLLDFLQEDVDAYSDAQIGAAVRDIHRGCKKALAEHMTLEPILEGAENAQVRVDAGFDPARIRLTGNVVGEPPFVGALRHHGWRVKKVDLPTGTASDGNIVTPAEVELT
jgi:hypothetical protein